ncbi:MAG TPA: hypothetical protein VHQ01_06370, partial [Pyrinomonadaceae bacterium]|nr:hypothetical protein [Pyrinomonadaceae bacterium]
MYSTFKLFLAVFLLSGFAVSQQVSRDQKIQNIFDLRSQITVLEKDIIQPDAKDIVLAQQLGFSAIRLLPREKYDGVLAISGGGAYYSFALNRQPYGSGSDIGLEQGYLSVGFAGADYGFLRDLGEIGLNEINRETPVVDALLKYVPPVDEPSVRAESKKLWKGYDINGFSFLSRVPATVGHSFLLR